MTREAPRRRAATAPLWRRLASVPVRLALSAGLLLGFGVVGTFAAWNDTSTVTGGTLSSGTMDLQFDTNGAAGLDVGYTKSSITWTDFVPGQTKAFPLTVKNVGNPSFTYSATTKVTSTWGFTGNPITLRVYTGTPNAGATACTGTGLTAAAVPVTATSTSVMTSTRTLAGSSATDPLCLELTFLSSATSVNQGKSGVIQLDFTANQVVP